MCFVWVLCVIFLNYCCFLYDFKIKVGKFGKELKAKFFRGMTGTGSGHHNAFLLGVEGASL